MSAYPVPSVVGTVRVRVPLQRHHLYNEPLYSEPTLIANGATAGGRTEFLTPYAEPHNELCLYNELTTMAINPIINPAHHNEQNRVFRHLGYIFTTVFSTAEARQLRSLGVRTPPAGLTPVVYPPSSYCMSAS